MKEEMIDRLEDLCFSILSLKKNEQAKEIEAFIKRYKLKGRDKKDVYDAVSHILNIFKGN